ncbi:uncharacterized protein FOMMEDRAFT_169058 [Fomitiporia mediterranea MF3/22]|uniref:uncharacterized protein n=1 Tax=Fomitiporia mediterranea (strain MF3/22) TaxID=694068 RepID=UPI00044075F9|nr:uncharacterized protein FOMMEDRAFT_169058 [Fomitiporia mediterranea MF3/22]EJD00806.1 hypothetical protein FOMMEDRAFT_169058 [Fomitiporia mediterranea MF3/22]
MTNRAAPKRPGLTSPPVSTTSSTQPPSSVQQLTPDSKLSASCISLSPGFSVHFAVFSAQNAAQSHLDVDLARRKVHESNSGRPIYNCLLTHPHLAKDEATLWVFTIDQGIPESDGIYASPQLRDLELPGLARNTNGSLTYAELYPCSTTCSSQRIPCPNCLRISAGSEITAHAQTSPGSINPEPEETTPAISPTSSHGRTFDNPSVTCHLPRKPLRQALAFFLSAVQERVISDICEDAQLSGKVARRLQTGILWGLPSLSSNWGGGWEQHAKTRPLTFTHIDVTLFPSGLFIRPQAQLTNFLPFLPSLPLPPGTPINLLPFSTPAYYLNMYSGSTSALTRHFQANLVGLGAGDVLPSRGTDQTTSSSENTTQFVIAWISVQNKQGEEKGMMVIWPAPLCISLMSMSTSDTPDEQDGKRLFAYNRKPLAYIPELPLALQASPVPAPATVPPLPRPTSPHDPLVSPSLFTPVGRRSFSRETSPSTPFPFRSANHLKSERPPITRATSSFSAETTQAFRTLTISQLPSSGLRNVAEGVGKFVDFMAKERERERERIKKEKEASAAAAQAQKGSDLPLSLSTTIGGGATANLATNGLITLQNNAIQEFAGLTPESMQVTPSIAVNVETSVSLSPQVQQQQTPAPPGQPAYPSPPEETVKSEQNYSIQNNGTLGGYALEPPSTTAQQVQPAPSETFDSFEGIDKYMMDLDMDFTMALPSSAGNPREIIKADFDSMVFTDDDFSFFDDPVVTTSIPSTTIPDASAMTGDEALKALGVASLTQDTGQSAVPDSGQSLVVTGTPSPWTSRKPTEGVEGKDTMESVAPDLLPGSPDESTSSLGPDTPEIINSSSVEILSSETHPFNPIRFSKRFCSSDAKYAVGKFSRSLIEQDSSSSSPRDASSVPVLWKISYASLTDPRVEIVKKLIGMKRRMLTQGMRLGLPPRPFREEQRSEWESCCAAGEDDNASGAAMDVESDRDSDDDGDERNCYEDDDAVFVGDDDYSSVSRPSTPLASHLPLGPSLLATQFQHSLLLPLSVNLRPSGASSFSFATDLAEPMPNPVPTPVSPAAAANSSSERSKVVELVVRAFAEEVVENAIWEEGWRVNAVGQAPIWKQENRNGRVEEVVEESYVIEDGWCGQRMSVGSFSSLAASSLYSGTEGHNASFKPLDQPMFTVGKADTLIQIAPPAFRFWSKMGLTPRSGPKDVVAFVFYEDGSSLASEVEGWLSRVSSAYTAKGYGTHSLRKSSLCAKDGLVPVRYATFRKALSSLIDSVGSTTSPLLLYIVTPTSILSMNSPILRQIFLSMHKVLSSSREEPVIRFQLVPEFLLTAKDDVTTTSQVETFVDNVYERIPRPVKRYMSRSLLHPGERTRRYFEAPSFVLGRPSTTSTSLSFCHPPPDSGLLDRHTLLHVGYRLTKCRKWLVAACIDQRGEGHELGVWFVPSSVSSDEGIRDGDRDRDWYKRLVAIVWGFAMEFARRANVEWRVAVAKLGSVGEGELAAWNALLNEEMSEEKRTSSMQVSILSVDDESGWSVLTESNKNHPSTQRPGSSHDSSPTTTPTKMQSQNQSHNQSQLSFASASSSYILPSLRLPLTSPFPSGIVEELGRQSFIPEDEESPKGSTNSAERLLPLCSSVLVTVPSTPPHSTSPSPSSPHENGDKSGNGNGNRTTPRTTLIHLLHSTSFPSSHSNTSSTCTPTSSSSPSSLSTKTIEETQQDIVKNYYELGVLTQARWRFSSLNGNGKGQRIGLPYHLAALRVVDECLEVGEVGGEFS